jgi:hypothetical protein
MLDTQRRQASTPAEEVVAKKSLKTAIQIYLSCMLKMCLILTLCRSNSQ